MLPFKIVRDMHFLHKLKKRDKALQAENKATRVIRSIRCYNIFITAQPRKSALSAILIFIMQKWLIESAKREGIDEMFAPSVEFAFV